LARRPTPSTLKKRSTGLIVNSEEAAKFAAAGVHSPVTLTKKQTEAITRTEHIIGVGGAKFGGKTFGGIMWLVGDVVFIGAILGIIAAWMRHEERHAPAAERRADAERALLSERADRLARSRAGDVDFRG